MPRKTKTQEMIEALETLEYVEITNNRVKKYRTFKCKHINELFLFVGNNGSVRQGRTATESRSIGDTNKALFIKAAKNRQYR